MYIFNTLTTLLYIRFPGKDVIACLTAFAGLHGITQARVCRLAVSSLESVCPPLDSRGKAVQALFGAEYNFYAAYLRACVFRAMRNRALPHPPRVIRAIRNEYSYAMADEDWGWRRRSCVFFAATESSSEAFDSSWSSGKPVVKVCHFNTQVTCDFLTHLVFRTSV